jgi:hypothetical protein
MNSSLAIPQEIAQLVNQGIWPRDHASSLKQNLKSIIPADVIRKFAPEENSLYLYPPPFHTAQDEIDNQKDSFWLDPRSAIHEIDPGLSVIIGDFGLGSDAAIILDYRDSLSEPRVMRLCWAESGNHWIECAKTFSEFAAYFREQQTEQGAAANP